MEDSALRRALKNILAGTFGGIAIVFVGHPFDTYRRFLVVCLTNLVLK